MARHRGARRPDAPVEVTVDEDLAVLADPGDVERAVRLLLSNVIMHTPVGTRVWISAEPDRSHVTLTVADDGPRVPDELKEPIFEPFRSGGSRVDYYPGIGPGRSVVAKIATNHNGRTWVTDRQGCAAFHLRLPAALPPSDADRAHG